jgi:hypothetical protein
VHHRNALGGITEVGVGNRRAPPPARLPRTSTRYGARTTVAKRIREGAPTRRCRFEADIAVMGDLAGEPGVLRLLEVESDNEEPRWMVTERAQLPTEHYGRAHRTPGRAHPTRSIRPPGRTEPADPEVDRTAHPENPRNPAAEVSRVTRHVHFGLVSSIFRR